ncbi:hypothetical protein COO60DRAFT_1461579 [Scenedesmus sp. NREL 46B-D3]|nr:hypothetical protein COO60DRAFT_1461579 [Scenedesmus sp. NREL 46B-D3]
MAEEQSGLQLLQLPSTVLVTSITFSCFHPELLHSIPGIVARFPGIQRLSLAHCSALPEQSMLSMQAWPLQQLGLTNMWHWDGAGSSTCMAAWGRTLTCLTADTTALPLAAVDKGADKLMDRVEGRCREHGSEDCGCLAGSFVAGPPAATHAAPAATGAPAVVAPSSKARQHYTPGFAGLSGLELAGCNSVSGFALQRAAGAGLLSELRLLDLSDVEALRQPNAAWNVAANVAAVAGMAGVDSAASQQQDSDDAAALPPPTVLGCVFSSCGAHLACLALDGCHVDDATAAFIGTRCRRLQRLSLVGCRGLGSVGLHALLSGCGQGKSDLCCGSTASSSSSRLSSLQLGGSRCRWREAEALSGVSSLTELRLLRRSSVRDADLAPVLAANAGLRRLLLACCHSLTDQLFLMVAAQPRAEAACMRRGADARLDNGQISVSGTTAAASSAHPTGALHAAALHTHLTALTLTACDGMHGSSIALLRGLRHLRLSFCASVTCQAVQQVVLSCSRLVLLELPPGLQQQLAAAPYSCMVQATGHGSYQTCNLPAQRSGSGGCGGTARQARAQNRTAAGAAGAAVSKGHQQACLPLQGPGDSWHRRMMSLLLSPVATVHHADTPRRGPGDLWQLQLTLDLLATKFTGQHLLIHGLAAVLCGLLQFPARELLAPAAQRRLLAKQDSISAGMTAVERCLQLFTVEGGEAGDKEQKDQLAETLQRVRQWRDRQPLHWLQVSLPADACAVHGDDRRLWAREVLHTHSGCGCQLPASQRRPAQLLCGAAHTSSCVAWLPPQHHTGNNCEHICFRGHAQMVLLKDFETPVLNQCNCTDQLAVDESYVCLHCQHCATVDNHDRAVLTHSDANNVSLDYMVY